MLSSISHYSKTLSIFLFSTLVIGCGGGSNKEQPEEPDNGTSSNNGGANNSGTANYNVIANIGAGGNGTLSANSATENDTVALTISSDTGHQIAEVTGCSGTLAGNVYTTAPLTQDCTIDVTFTAPSQVSEPTLTLEKTKIFQFSWSESSDATHYRLLENKDGVSGYTQVGNDISPGVGGNELVVPLYDRVNAQYILQTCYDDLCLDSQPINVQANLLTAAGYIKASNATSSQEFGYSISLNADATTMAVGATGEASAAVGVNGDQSDNSENDSGAVYLFQRVDNRWQQQAYLKASNSESGDYFGFSVSLSDEGNTLAVGAISESSDSNLINGDQSNNDASSAGAAYVFARADNQWSQTDYIKAFNSYDDHWFGWQVDLSSDGTTLAVSAPGEDSTATGIDGSTASTGNSFSGAVYVFKKDSASWQQTSYIKASNASAYDNFGWSMALSGDGQALAVGALNEQSNATGINGNQTDNSLQGAGAVYLFNRANSTWSQQAYIKPNAISERDEFGSSVALSFDGQRLAVGAINEGDSGAAYVFDSVSGQWQQVAYLKDTSPLEYDYFGWSVSLSGDGNLLAVGAPQDTNEGSGKANLFKFDGTQWSLLSELSAPNGSLNIDFGYQVSFSSDGNTLAISDHYENSAATGINGDIPQAQSEADSGSVHLY